MNPKAKERERERMKRGVDAETQSDFRDSETQTSCFHLIVPEKWRTVQPHPWVLEGCFVGFQRARDLECRPDVEKERLLFARGKETVSVRAAPLVFPRGNHETDSNITSRHEFLEKNQLVLESFNSLPLDDLRTLEPQLASRSSLGRLHSSDASVGSERASLESRWLSRLTKSLQKGSDSHRTLSSSVFQQSQTPLAKSNQKYYSVHVGKHRRILTPRCDSSLVARMERSNAVILLQRCLRGRAAQISMAETRMKCLELYDELNELEDVPRENTDDTAYTSEDILSVQALVGQQFFDLFTSFLASTGV